ncbi:hypothetical protein RHGRI_019269 [Rhododendron griersonianum]|uniref:C2H2-type domain-containing protein n=1 Tax=Rhododendron griersonianum TaxID=479676 RepID=A0AAV6JFB1_9ERIC|nr:hypothetical protein RHGRI_019269 [Rhododendron griersonianum]
MDKHRCKLCFKRFANGRAMGGHMRSHMVNHQFVPPKSEPQLQLQQQHHHQQQQQLPNKDIQLSEEFDSASSFSSEEEEENEEKLLGYELRENPKKSTRLVDREFSFTTAGSAVVLIQDRESETESSKNPVRRRSKRIRRSGISKNYDHNNQFHNPKQPQMKRPKSGKTESEPEPVSSISNTTPDEDVAYCLMMLSRDAWMRDKDDDDDKLEETQEKTEDSGELNNNNKPTKIRSRNRGKYKCETCFKLFRSYQALGGHRASHKKVRAIDNGFQRIQTDERLEIEKRINVGVDEEKIHECPVCYRVFASGQALGGHKRSHGIGPAFGSSSTTATPVKPKLKSGEPLIDLNLPAPVDDDDDDDYGDEISQIDNPAVSDAEFVNPIKH